MAISDTLSDIRKRLLDTGKTTQPVSAQQAASAAKKVTSYYDPIEEGSMNGSTVGNPILMHMFQDGTDQEITEYLNTGRVPASYANRHHPQNYTFWNGGNVDPGWKIDDSNADAWKRVRELYTAGDTQGAMGIVNGLLGNGASGGYYDEDGKYWGFAVGHQGGANSSYQPVLGGTIMTTGLDTTGTDIWLTPDGKALKMGDGGALTDQGDTWSKTRQSDPAVMHFENAQKIEEAKKAAPLVNGGRDPYAADPVPNAAGGMTHTFSGNPTMPVGSTGGQAPTVVPTGNAATGTGSNPGTVPQAETPAAASAAKKAKEATVPQPVTSAAGTTPPAAPTTTAPANTPAPEGVGDPVTGGAITATPTTKTADTDTTPHQAALSEVDALTPPDPTQNTMYQKVISEYENETPPEWEGSPYQDLRDEYTQRAAEMEWNYDPNTDPVWQALKKQYLREGRRATEDTLGRYAAMTGGMPSTAAVSAATQAGNYYAAQLSDRLPEVYQQAYQRYLEDYKKQLGIAEAYDDYLKTEYGIFRDNTDDWYKNQQTAYQMALDNIAMEQQGWENTYKVGQDAQNQANLDREFEYNAARDIIQDAKDQRDYEFKMMEFAYQQQWDMTKWVQYLQEYADQLSEQQKAWVWEQIQFEEKNAQFWAQFEANREDTAWEHSQAEQKTAWDMLTEQFDMDRLSEQQKIKLAETAAQYGDYSGLEALGIDTSSANPKEVAYAADGSMYKFNTPDAQYFVQNAPNGTPGNPTTMTGGDGSIWRKDEYGGITIEKNGKVYTYSNPVVPETKNTGTYRYVKDTGNTDDDYIAQMTAAGVKTYNGALSWLAMHTDKSDAKAKAIASDFMERLGNEDAGAKYTEEDIDYARDLVNGKYPNANPAMISWAQQVMSDTYGLDFSSEEQAPAPSLEYGDLVRDLDRMAAQGRSWDEIKTEIEAAHRDGMITDAEYDQLREKYHDETDNIPNSGKKHSNGKPMSQRFYDVLSTVRGKPTKAEMISALDEAVSKNLIHDYEIHIIMDYLELD